MKRFLSSIALAASLALCASGQASAQAAAQATVLSATQATQLATAVIHGRECDVYQVLKGMDMTKVGKAVEEIAAAGQQLQHGSMGTVVLDGDADQKSITLMVISGKYNIAAYHTMFSKAHPLVDETNSWCFDQH